MQTQVQTQAQTVNQQTLAFNEKEKPVFVRTKDSCYKLQKSSYWGEYYIPIKDPKGVEKPAELDYLWLKQEFDKLPFHLLQGIVTFFRCYMNMHGSGYVQGSTEVQVCLLRGAEDPSQWKVVVPKQVVTAVTVDAATAQTCDLFTGEEYTVFPPEGYCHSGSIHSHAGMSSFWSGRDDKGELGVPGMHCTIGVIKPDSFDICSSIVLNGKRYIFQPNQLIDFNGAKIKPSNDSCKSTTIFNGTVVPISETAKQYVERARPFLGTSWITKGMGNATTTLMPRSEMWTANDWDKWDDWDEWGGDWDGWSNWQNKSTNQKRNRYRDYDKDIKHELKHTLETTDLSGRHNPIDAIENIDELKDILNNLDLWADALLVMPRGKEVLAAMLAQKLDLNIYMPIAEEIINTCLY